MNNFILTRQNKSITPSFACPNCDKETAHSVNILKYQYELSVYNLEPKQNEFNYTFFRAVCAHCYGISFILNKQKKINNSKDYNDNQLLWQSPLAATSTEYLLLEQRIVEPDLVPGIPPVNNDLSDDVKNLYHEAASVMAKSPRAATALLRLALETMLTVDFNLIEGSINKKIGNLYSNNIPAEIETALHFVRIAGNAADHIEPGLIKLDGSDGEETVQTLFTVINFIADDQITRKKKLKGLSKFFTPNQQKGIDDLHKKIDKQKTNIGKELS